jgi:uncharacterized phage-associated protein
MITKDDFQLWKSEPVTKALYESFDEVEYGAMMELSVNRADSVSDDWYKGYIMAVRDMKNMSLAEDTQ